ncbi:MAG: S41 family peptidase [Patescibacteria group bacterium]|nr:S41 family peptidase [Patescibacteria group bacterium]
MKRVIAVSVFFLLSFSIYSISFGGDVRVTQVETGGIGVVKSVDRLFMIQTVLAYIESSYYKKVDMDKCFEQILNNGISDCTDQYSYFLNKEEAQKESLNDSGFYEGIGIQYDVKKGTAIITHIYPDSSAEKSGMKVGDVIAAISPTGIDTDSVPVSGLDWNSISVLLNGKDSNKKLIVYVKRKRDLLAFKEEIGAVKDPSVFFTKLSKKIGYVRLTGFIDTTEDDFRSAVSSFSQAGVGVLIIDLRDNPGGSVESAVNIASFFQANSDPIIYTRSRDNPEVPIIPDSETPGIFKDQKVIVLVNENSASAAEILSGWLKEERGAIVIGEHTYGKGVMQTLFDLPGGARLHLTTDQYFIGSKKVDISKVGVQPTIKVKQSSDPKSKIDDQFQRAFEKANKIARSLK